uniref:bifunctional phosphatase IMPL2, chloroplastic n=1 Tax=Erigeron canadensis TaxID=72917 RepID=UPI001CB93B96|nr:bifunctional phosphatase IMPL2, chloroplastic [Erigeron canadensis]
MVLPIGLGEPKPHSFPPKYLANRLKPKLSHSVTLSLAINLNQKPLFFSFSLSRHQPTKMLQQSHFLSLSINPNSNSGSSYLISSNLIDFNPSLSSSLISKKSLTLKPFFTKPPPISISMTTPKSTLSNAVTDHRDSEDLDHFETVADRLADASGDVIRKYFRKRFDIVDKPDLSPVTIADRAAEEAMTLIIQESFPSHAIYGEENGWQCKENSADYVWVLDPIDGTKSFITGKPLFGTLIALLHRGKPILGIIDQPILRERWVGITGRTTKLNREEISTRSCPKLSQAYLYTTSPHLFSGDAVEAFARVRDKVKVPLYGCDCYAYALLASGHVDLVVESGLKPYDFLSLIPVIEGAGGVITDWNGNHLSWEASPNSQAKSFNVVAAGDKELHQQTLDCLEWR